jgi:hypothetical protein
MSVVETWCMVPGEVSKASTRFHKVVRCGGSQQEEADAYIRLESAVGSRPSRR